MTMRASAIASALVPPRRFSIARASFWTVIIAPPRPHIYWVPRPPYRFAAKARGTCPHAWSGAIPPITLISTNIEEYPLRRLGRTDATEGVPVKRKSGKPIVDLEKKVSVVHFNVGSGYLTYLEQDAPEVAPRVKSVVISKETQ